MFDLPMIIQLGVLLVTVTGAVVGMQWSLASLKDLVAANRRESDDSLARLDKAVTTIGNKLDEERHRITIAENNITHQSGALFRIESAINTATARLEIQIGNLQRQLNEVLVNRKES